MNSKNELFTDVSIGRPTEQANPAIIVLHERQKLH